MEEVGTSPRIKQEASSSPHEHDVAHKRKASTSPKDNHQDPRDDAGSAKRPRVDSHDDGPLPDQRSPTSTHRRDSTQGPDRRTSQPVSKDEEKKRGKRLFGGLLSTLNQGSSSSASAQQKRRREIELRQQERAQRQRAEDDKRAAEKLAKINEFRRQGQVGFEEKVMKTRHANFLARAHSLQTKSEPRIYYRPWKLTGAQEDTVDGQIADAKTTLAREVDEFNRRRQRREGDRRLSRDDETAPDPASRVASAPPPAAAESSAAPKPAPTSDETSDAPADTTDDHAGSGGHDRQKQHQLQNQHQRQNEESGDVVAEAEDMVMY